MKRYPISILVLGAALLIRALAVAQDSQEALITKEKSAWEAFKTKNPGAFSALAADDMVAVDQDGAVGKVAEVKMIEQVDLKDYALSDIKVMMPAKDTAIVTYKAAQQGTYKGQPLPPTLYASSMWVKRGDTWLAVFHQETLAAPAAP